jgi:tetratricopeptide (TPR) repeat protein
MFSSRQVYLNNLQFEASRQDALRATQINPQFFKAHYRLGRALFALRRPREALVAYDNALKLEPTSEELNLWRDQAVSALKFVSSVAGVVAEAAPSFVADGEELIFIPRPGGGYAPASAAARRYDYDSTISDVLK